MIHGKRVIVVLPAYNAARTLEKTYAELPLDVVDEIILVDDTSQDARSEVARSLGMPWMYSLRLASYRCSQDPYSNQPQSVAIAFNDAQLRFV